MHQLYDEAFAAEIPYNIAVVETEEGVRLTSQVVDCPNERLEIGMALDVTFERMSDEVAVPKFRPAVMSYDHVIYEKRGHVAYVTLNRPERMNALDAHSHVELIEIFDDFARDDDAVGGDRHRRRRPRLLRRQRPEGDGPGVGRRGAAGRPELALRRASPAATTARSR